MERTEHWTALAAQYPPNGGPYFSDYAVTHQENHNLFYRKETMDETQQDPGHRLVTSQEKTDMETIKRSVPSQTF